MFVEVQASNHTRHFPAYYQEYVAVYGIKPVELLAGTLPKRQQRLVEAWAELHQAELSADWNRLQTDLGALPLAPLA
jgi:hypothetical protein